MRVDCPLLEIDSTDTNLSSNTSRITKRHRTWVHVVFRNDVMCNALARFLKDGCVVVEGSDGLSYEMVLHFEDAAETKDFMDLKEKETRDLWKKYGY